MCVCYYTDLSIQSLPIFRASDCSVVCINHCNSLHCTITLSAGAAVGPGLSPAAAVSDAGGLPGRRQPQGDRQPQGTVLLYVVYCDVCMLYCVCSVLWCQYALRVLDNSPHCATIPPADLFKSVQSSSSHYLLFEQFVGGQEGRRKKQRVGTDHDADIDTAPGT